MITPDMLLGVFRVAAFVGAFAGPEAGAELAWSMQQKTKALTYYARTGREGPYDYVLADIRSKKEADQRNLDRETKIRKNIEDSISNDRHNLRLAKTARMRNTIQKGIDGSMRTLGLMKRLEATARKLVESWARSERAFIHAYKTIKATRRLLRIR